MRYSCTQGAVRRRTKEAARSICGTAAEVSGMESSQRAPRHSISASTKREVRNSRGSASFPVMTRASDSVRSERSGVSSARMKVCKVAIIVIPFLR